MSAPLTTLRNGRAARPRRGMVELALRERAAFRSGDALLGRLYQAQRLGRLADAQAEARRRGAEA